jgi:acetyl esterase
MLPMNADDVHGLIALLEQSGAPPVIAEGTDTASLITRFPELATVSIAPVSIPGPNGPVEARHYRTAHPSSARLLWVHGGAFVAGDLDMPESNWVALVLASRGIDVLAVDYRKALSGVRFPVPSDDVLAAWRWAEAHLGAGFHLGGASAGANLTAGVTARLRDAGEPLPETLVQVYPLVHATLPAPSEELLAATSDLPDPVRFEDDAVIAFNRNFVEDDPTNPYAFPGEGNPAGFPPVYVVNAQMDTLRASGERFVEQLRTAGVPVTGETEPAALHGYLNEPGDPSAMRTLDGITAWIRAH